MALKIELEGLRPGRGRLRVSGAFDEPESVALAIQRNDGRYLGAAEVWQATPHWHPQFSVRSDGAALTLDIGAEIIDGVIAVGGRPLRVVLRIDGGENDGILRVKGELIGSGAAAANQEHCDPLDSAAVFAAAAASDGAAPVADTGDGASAEDPEVDQPRRAGVGFWLILALLLALFTAAGGAWYLGLLDERLGAEPESAASAEATLQPSATSGPMPGAAPPVEAQPSPELELRGIALARSILEGRPAPDAIYAKAEQAERRGDCAAALVLFNEAAGADPRFAASLARRYDPHTFEPGGCIEQSDAPYAIVFFADAARAGDLAAQRRLGQLMTERERSGATYEEGRDWLRKAAESGDAEAGRVLKELGE